MLAILADEPAFFVARENTTGDIVALALLLILGPPTVLVAVEALFGRAEGAREDVHLIFVGLLAAALILQVVSDAGGPGALWIALAVVGGATFMLAYSAYSPVSSALSVLAPVPLLVIAWFLFLSPVSDVVFPERLELATSADRPSGPAPPIVFVVFDEFFGGAIMDSQGRIDRTRYPNFAELAEQVHLVPQRERRRHLDDGGGAGGHDREVPRRGAGADGE